MKNTLKKRVALVAALLVGTSALTLNAANIKKTVTAAYYNIKVKVDGQYKTPTNEPFMIGDSVYVGLRDFSELTGNEVGWDGATKTVSVTPKESGASSTEIANKNLEIAKLKSEVASLQSKLDQYEKEEEADKEDPNKDVLPNISQKDIDNLIEDLTDDFEGELGINWIFELTPNTKEGRLDLTIALDRTYDLNTFKEITDDELEEFLDEVSYDIHKELGKISIAGELQDHKGKLLSKFTFSKTSKLNVDHDKNDVQLERLNFILDEQFTSLKKIEPFFTATTTIDSITADASSSFRKITIDISADLSAATDKDKWNEFYDKASSSQKNILYKDLSLISSYVEEYFNIDEDNIAISLYDETGKVTLATYDSDGGTIKNWPKE